MTKSADGKLYALKRVYTSDPAYYKKEIKSLKLYGELIAKSDIKNIIPILDVRTTDSEVEYLMPLADGMNADSPFERSWEPTTLTKLVKARYDSGGTFTAKEAVEIFKPLIEAVSKLNDKGVIHRDIKPDNILFIGGRPYIADIGLFARRHRKRKLRRNARLLAAVVVHKKQREPRHVGHCNNALFLPFGQLSRHDWPPELYVSAVEGEDVESRHRRLAPFP